MISQQQQDACTACIGRERHVEDTLAPENAQKLAVLLGRDIISVLPTTWHWIYFNQAIAETDVGHDGHERLGVFMPPVPLMRRMWAAGDIKVATPLVLGIPAERRTKISDVVFKTGKSGILCFVTVEHKITQQGQLAIGETQTVVYRDRGTPETALRDRDDPIPDGFRVLADTTLVGYSALTHNGHRIHWDRDFCRNEEGYPGLVVHGPLLATLLADRLVPEPEPVRFTYRATAPVFETSPFRLQAERSEAQIVRSDGKTAMVASIARGD